MAAVAGPKVFTLAEVKKHTSKQSCWLVISNKVYDVTGWLKGHPGGADALLEGAGSHATRLFEDVGHSSEARSMLPKYYIGDIAEADREADKKKKK